MMEALQLNTATTLERSETIEFNLQGNKLSPEFRQQV